MILLKVFFFFSSRRRHTRLQGDWSSDVCSSDLFRLASAVLLPGDRTRRDALIVEGRVAARMIGAVVTLLAIAGTIEGLLSASDAPTGYKYLTSGLSVVFLVIYCASGRAFLARRRAPLGSGPQSQLLG